MCIAPCRSGPSLVGVTPGASRRAASPVSPLETVVTPTTVVVTKAVVSRLEVTITQTRATSHLALVSVLKTTADLPPTRAAGLDSDLRIRVEVPPVVASGSAPRIITREAASALEVKTTTRAEASGLETIIITTTEVVAV